ncbi:MAG: tetratricopeptide repeat protein [Lewinellaceae bacterium]|nr:tetratricopeptide repeat protein [Saprospiraceae bacterium]MCB9337243.1 tetratricopeptide repeat protein [Lewinellaceae bacterium]
MSKYLLLLLPVLFALPAKGQDDGFVTETEIKTQEIFLDGIREKLLGNWDKAIPKFQEVLEKEPTNGAAAFELARAYEATKDMEKAVAAAKNAADWDAGNTWFKKYLADLYQLTSKDKDAASIYEQLAKSDPHNEEYYFKWAYFLVRAGEPEKAIKVYDSLEKMIGVNEETTRHKHTLYLGMGDYKKAGKELENLVAIFPEKTEYQHLLATFYDQIDQKEKSREVYKTILQIDPNDARAKIALAESAKGNDDVAFLNSLKPVFENPNVNIDVKITEILPYVTQFADTGGKDLGVALLELVAVLEKMHPNSAKAYSVLGDVLYYAGERESALEKYKKTLELDDNVWAVWEQLLYIYADQQDYANLAKYSEKALDIFPNQATAQYLNGLAYNGTEKYKDALGSLQQALLMSGNNSRLRYEILNEMGKTYFYLKQYDRSDESFEEALQLNPNEPLVLRNYSYHLAARPNGATSEQLAKAKQLAEKLNDLAPNLPAHEDALAFVFYKMKDFNSAKSWLEKAIEHGGSNNPSVLEHYGDVLFQMGNAASAVEYWQKAVEAGGKSLLLKKKAAEGKMYE